ncbi:MAG: hypothetical protein C0616_07600 [Desulfuromonas sp.]|nr:MAG: hypothetical protein C0616_07600 [Desulfuromonas sp.]
MTADQPLAIALVHHPVRDRNGALITAAVTNLDLHDLARSAKTFGVERFYVVTPVAEQQRLVTRLLDHWVVGHGASYNPDRAAALELAAVVDSLDQALADWRQLTSEDALPLLTGAQRCDGISFSMGRQMLKQRPILLTLGTGSGLAEELFENEWPVLEPIAGVAGYNHLPVRAAAAIMLDRIKGTGKEL